VKKAEYVYKNATCFDLKQTFECGQCFRWKKEENGSYTGVLNVGVVNVQKCNEDIIFLGFIDDDVDFEAFCECYFDLKEDYEYIQKQLLKNNDLVMKKAIAYGNGIRILNQDPWETMISFIISAANNIPRITKTINNISEMFGRRVETDLIGEKRTYYIFPTPSELSRASMADLRECNLGFRDKFVYNATESINSSKVSLDTIRELDYEVARKELMRLPGIGGKVADCILLFSMQKKEAFPVDTWIKKIMNEEYIESKSAKKIEEFAKSRFGKFSGIAQQYLFYYKREDAD
jgi:N-glycosylase/DNA lyase